MTSGETGPTDVNIVHYHTGIRLEQGGVVRAVLDLSTALAAAGHAVTLITANAQDVPAPWRDGDAGTPRVIETRVRPGARRHLAKRLAGADVLHLHGMWTPDNIELAAAARRAGVPYVISVHGMLDDWCMATSRLRKRLFLAAVGRRLLHDAAAVHCTAQAELEQARVWFPRGRGVVIPLVCDLTPFETLPGPEPARRHVPEIGRGDPPTLLFLSRLHRKKGIELLIGAAEELANAGRPCLVLIAGTGDEPYVATLRSTVADRGLGERVRFVGFIDGVEKISLYESADLFVLPTSQENFGFVLFEALAAGTAVITTRGADTWPEMESSGGAVVTEASPSAIADAAAALLDDPARRQAMGAAGRRWVFGHLAAECVIGEYESFYRAAAGGG
ncbi:MAG: glycosyltransferase [Phycisphaerales bacterium]|nr:glycosyltransferase [Phycisphaerales bacterium]NNM25811.1 glycosyltransferase [Phycisphaerales bacterium]